MNMKKIFSLLLLFLVSFTAYGCSFNNFKLSIDLIKENSAFYSDLFDYKLSYKEYEFNLDYEIIDSKAGFYTIVNEEGLTAVYSLYKNKIIVPFDAILVSYDYVGNIPIIIINKFKAEEGTEILYNTKIVDFNNQTVLLEENCYESYEYDYSMDYDNGYAINIYFNYLVKGEEEAKTLAYSYDLLKDKFNELKLNDDLVEDEYEYQDKVEYEPYHFDMTEYGLKNYQIDLDYKNGETLVKVYKKDKLVSTYLVPKRISQSDLESNVNGNIIIQEVLETTKNNKYDFVEEENNNLVYYDIKTTKINLKTGKMKNLDVDYIINTFDSINGLNKKNKYGMVHALCVEDKKLLESDKILYINENGKILEDDIYVDIKNCTIINGNIYDIYNSRYYNSKFKLLFDFKDNKYGISFVNNNSKYLICEDNNENMGVIDYNFNVIVPFEYDDVEFVIDGIFLGEKDDEKYIISKGEAVLVSENQEIVNSIMLATISEEANENGLYEIKVEFIDGKEMFTYYSKSNNIDDSLNYDIHNGGTTSIIEIKYDDEKVEAGGSVATTKTHIIKVTLKF